MRILTIGTSLITTLFIEALKQVEGAHLQAIYSRDEKKAQRFAQEMGALEYYTDLNLALENPQIDAVYIASPNSLHYQHAKAALLANKHVLCEKPFVSTSAQLEELELIATKKQLILMEAITTLYLPNFKKIQALLAELGEIKLINLNYSQFSSRYPLYLDKQVTNIFDPAFDGGALRDINVYNIHFVTYLFGEPQEVIYYPNQGFNKIDTSGVLILDYGHFKAVLSAAKDSTSESFAFIQGDKKTIHVFDSSVGRCEKVSLIEAKTNESQIISIKQKMHMVYEVEMFKKMIDDLDFDLRDDYLHHSKRVLKVIERALSYVK